MKKMRPLLFIFIFLSACGLPHRALYRDHERCELIIKDTSLAETVVSLADLPLPTEIKHHQGLWCDDNHLQASMTFEVYNEKWALVFLADHDLKVKVNPYGEEGHKHAKSWQVNMGGDKGCKIIQKPGEVFQSEEILSKSNQAFSLRLYCKNND